MNPTRAPSYSGSGSVLATGLSCRIQTEQGEIPVIALEARGKATLLIEESGEARLIRPRKGRSGYSNAMVYASPKVFKIINPFTQPMSALFHFYEQCLTVAAGEARG